MVYSTRRFVVCLSMCYFVLVYFSPFSIAITSLGEERANLSACLDLSVSSSSWGLGRAAVCDCGTSWTFLLPCFCFLVSTRRFVLCLALCYFVLVFFSHLALRLPRKGRERANLSAFRTFVQFVLVWLCWFPLPLGVWEELRFVIVTLPGLLSFFY